MRISSSESPLVVTGLTVLVELVVALVLSLEVVLLQWQVAHHLLLPLLQLLEVSRVQLRLLPPVSWLSSVDAV